ncbi:MAG: hypothetical protein Q8O67_20120 [Deltaproteobacteria bacterium]|nr:hypothetical protein [Deltaproteobacteria bacterium]
MFAALSVLAFSTVAQLSTPAAPPDAHNHGTHESERLKMLVMDLAAEGPVDAGTVKTLTGIVSAELAAYTDLDVMADADVRRMLELEGEKQSVGCGDTSCLADIAGAMGARLVVFGSIGKLGDTLVLHLNLYDSSKAQSVGRQFLEAKDVATLPRLLQPKLRALLERTYQEEKLVLPELPKEEPVVPPIVPLPPPKPEPSPLVPAVLIGGGAAGVVGGVVALYFGTDPYFIYADDIARFKTAHAGNDGELAGRLRDNAIGQADAWNSYGLPLAVTGGVLVVGGLVAAVVGTVGLVGSGDD